MKIAVTGATGFIGRALCAELMQHGHQVVALTRHPGQAQASIPGAEVIAWGNGAAASFPDVDGVVNLAGESIAGRWNEAKKRRLRESRIEGTRRLVEAMCSAARRPAVLVSTSAVGFYGDRGEEQLTEASGPGSDFLAHLCRDWEAEAQRAEELGVRVARLRLGVVLDRGGPLARMLVPFRLGVGGPLGSGRQWFPWVHRADVVGLFLLALENPEASGPINAVSPEMVRNSEFTRALGVALHRPAFLPAPAFALRLLLGEFADTLLGGQRVVPERAKALGYPYRFPQLAPALRDILDNPAHPDVSPGPRSGHAPAD